MEVDYRTYGGIYTHSKACSNQDTTMRFINCVYLLAFAASPALAQSIGDPDCDQLLLVSGYTNNNVKVYNACDYSFVRDLDSDGTLAGPQAMALDPEGNLIVVSESNARLVRYHRETLTYDAVIAGDKPETGQSEPVPVNNPTGLVIAPDGRMFVGSYSDQVVAQVDPDTGQAIKNIVTQADSGVIGPDTGMWLQGDRLIVPGFDSSTLVEANINQTGSSKQLVAPGSGGLNAPRAVLRQANGNLLVTSWRGNEILEFNGTNGSFVRVVAESFSRPTGMAFESDEILLVASDATNSISRVRIDTGENLGKVITFADGGLLAPTFILVLDKLADNLAENRAFWIIGAGEVMDNSIVVEQMNYTRGGAFGDNFNADDISREHWGSLRFDYLDCESADMSWEAVDPVFGTGGYTVVRLAPDPDGQRCLDEGFENVTGEDWMSGIWFGSADRSGEGFSINVLNDGLAVVTWYTYWP